MKPNFNEEDDFTEDELAGLKLAFSKLDEVTQAQMGAHLQVDDLERYYYHQMEPELMQQARTHLVSCDECSAQLLEYAAFCDPDGEELAGLDEVEAVAESTIDQPQRSDAEPGKRKTAFVPSFLVRVQSFLSRPQIAYALVVILLIVGLLWLSSVRREREQLLAGMNQPPAQDESAENARRALAEATQKIEAVQQQRDAERSRAEQLQARNAQLETEKNALSNNNNSRAYNAPLVNVPILPMPNRTRSGTGSTPVIEVPLNTTVFTLVVSDPAPDKTYSEYEIEIRDTKGASVVRENGLHFSKVLNTTALTLAIPTRSVPAGQYQFTVYGITDGRRTVEDDRLILVRYK